MEKLIINDRHDKIAILVDLENKENPKVLFKILIEILFMLIEFMIVIIWFFPGMDLLFIMLS